jgi:Bacteriodetes cell division protein (FtsL-like)
MNKLREQPQEVKKEKTTASKPNKFAKYFSSLITGSFLAKEKTLKQLPFIFFLTFLAICYVANGYYAERTIRNINKVSNQIKELQSQFITHKSQLMFITKQSEIAKACQNMGLKQSVTPPFKIVDTVTYKTAHND